MYESSTDVITFNMVSSFLSAVCIFLVIGAAFADDMPDDVKETMMNIHKKCAEENDAPKDMNEKPNEAHGCYYACFLENLGMLIENKVTISEHVPNHEEIQDCVDTRAKSDERCHLGTVAQQCMVEFGPKKPE